MWKPELLGTFVHLGSQKKEPSHLIRFFGKSSTWSVLAVSKVQL
jgi:hypothetical protein